MHRSIHLGYLEPNRAVSGKIFLIGALTAMFLAAGCAHQKPKGDWDLCPNLRVHGQIEPGLSETEKNLVCGDAKQLEWSKLPQWQSQYDLKNFLQDRGLYRPKFLVTAQSSDGSMVVVQDDSQKNVQRGSTVIREDVTSDPSGDKVYLDVGQPTRVTKVTAIDAPEVIDISRKRFVIGEVMTPALLSDLEGWTVHELRVYGYPCPKVRAEGDPDTGEVRVLVTRGPNQRVIREAEQLVPGMDAGVLGRFHAFGFNDPYNEDLTNLSSQRVTHVGLFDSDYFIPTCEAEGVSLTENVVVGPPRLVALGAGIDTEGFIQARASWTNARLGRKASVLTGTASGSSKLQELGVSLNWYAFEASDPKSINPSFQLLHDNESAFEIAQATAALQFQKSWEWLISRGTYQIGPQFEQVHTFRGTGPANARFLMLANSLEFMSHAYELNQTQPKSGFDLIANANFSKAGIITSATAQQLGFRYEALFNVLNKDPPLLVLGWRGSFNTTLTPDAQEQVNGAGVLPPTFTYFLGGSHDLRGFGRLSLPGDQVGRLTSAFSSVETRLVRVLPLDIQPFVFTDVGALGPLPATLRAPVYYSPGFGARWSPGFGTFRSTLARGYPLSAPGGFQFYFSFGEEF